VTERQASPEEIEQQIVRTRAEINQTIDALQAKLSPGQLLDRAIGYIKEGGGEFAGNFGRTVRDNPVPVALLGASMAWLMIAGRGRNVGGNGAARPWSGPESATVGTVFADEGRDASELTAAPATPVSSSQDIDGVGRGNGASGVAEPADEAGSRFEGAVHDARQGARELGDKASRLASSVGEAASRGFEGARQRTERYGGEARGKAEQARQAAGQFVRESPLVLGALALAAGATLAALLPTTRREDELMGEKSDELKDQVRAVASEQFDQAKEAAAAVREAAKEELSGLGKHRGPSESSSGQEGGRDQEVAAGTPGSDAQAESGSDAKPDTRPDPSTSQP